MKTWTVFFDCHKNGPTPTDVKPKFGENFFYGGDNHEMKNIPKDDVKKRVDEYRKFLAKCSFTHTPVVAGNHERKAGSQYCKNPEYFIDDGVLFLHGDILSFSEKTYRKWRYGKMGKSKLKIFFIKIKNTLFKNSSSKISKKKSQAAVKLLKEHSCHTMVFGHRHPKKIIDIAVIDDEKAYRIINCPRGRSEISV